MATTTTPRLLRRPEALNPAVCWPMRQCADARENEPALVGIYFRKTTPLVEVDFWGWRNGLLRQHVWDAVDRLAAEHQGRCTLAGSTISRNIISDYSFKKPADAVAFANAVVEYLHGSITPDEITAAQARLPLGNPPDDWPGQLEWPPRRRAR